jgi:beta-N-acetylhexosaminidase
LLWLKTSGIAVVCCIGLLAGGSAAAGRIPAPRTGSASRTLAAGSLAARSLAAGSLDDGNEMLAGTSLATASQVTAAVQSTDAALVARLSAQQLAGQRVIYSYAGAAPPASLLSLIRHGEAGGIIFFAGNYVSRSQFSRVVRQLGDANASASNPVGGYPLLLMTDQEGGEVRRLPGAPAASEEAIGAMKSLSAAEAAAGQAGSGAAASLRSYGLNVDLAPVLDVYRRPGDFDDQYQRSYSQQPAVVSALGSRFVRAMQAGEVAAAVKHFPGLGAATASQNTDERPVTLNLPAATIEGRDEYPYQAAIAAGVKLVMVSWAEYPRLGSTLPAGLSSAVVQGQLRGRLGYTGVTITDAIGAGALEPYGAAPRRAFLAARAGMDLILAASQTAAQGVQCVNSLASAYRSAKLPAAAFQAAVSRLLVLRQTLPS